MKELCGDGTYMEKLEINPCTLQGFLDLIKNEDYSVEIVNYGIYGDLSEIPDVLLKREIHDIIKQGSYNRWNYIIRLKA